MKKPRAKFFSSFFGILIDLLLIGTGIVLYFSFKVYSFGLNPLVINLFGSRDLAVLVISGLPFFIGLFSLLGTIFRAFKR